MATVAGATPEQAPHHVTMAAAVGPARRRRDQLTREYAKKVNWLLSIRATEAHHTMQRPVAPPLQQHLHDALLARVDKLELTLATLCKLAYANAPGVVTPEQLAEPEREAATTGEQLRADNAKLKETTEQLKLRYGERVNETAQLQKQAADNDTGALPPMSPRTTDETPQLAACREIAHIQEEVSALAKENSALVATEKEVESGNSQDSNPRQSPYAVNQQLLQQRHAWSLVVDQVNEAQKG